MIVRLWAFFHGRRVAVRRRPARSAAVVALAAPEHGGEAEEHRDDFEAS